MIPADLRLLDAKDLFINQSALTGEAMPAEKFCHPYQQEIKECRQWLCDRHRRTHRSAYVFWAARR
jgi:magnesium-transporting ATPase (P-type)